MDLGSVKTVSTGFVLQLGKTVAQSGSWIWVKIGHRDDSD